METSQLMLQQRRAELRAIFAAPGGGPLADRIDRAVVASGRPITGSRPAVEYELKLADGVALRRRRKVAV